MTTPGTTTDAATAAATSPVLGADPDRAGGVGGVDAAANTTSTSTTDEASAAVEATAAPLPTVGTYRDEGGRVHYASPHVKATRARLAAGEWTEVDDSPEAFDPTSKRVREVIAYLEEHAGDEGEVTRVKAAEAAGEDRPTIAAWSAVTE